jgi:hypothetical protein
MKSIVRADFSYAATLNIRERSSGWSDSKRLVIIISSLAVTKARR